MAFDDEYIYFNVSGRGTCRCRYDGSDVQCFEKKLENAVNADGKLWGYWYDSDAPEAAGLYSMDLKTRDMTQIIELPNKEDSITSILVSGNWLCYVGKGGTVLNVRDLTTGEEKTISEWAAPEYSAENENRTADIPMCIYGNTLYENDSIAKNDFIAQKTFKESCGKNLNTMFPAFQCFNVKTLNYIPPKYSINE